MTNVTTVMFVPSTVDGRLINKLENLEQKLYSEKAFDWNVKLVEKSGTPLSVLFIKKTPVVDGCPLNANHTEKARTVCTVCDDDAVACSPKTSFMKRNVKTVLAPNYLQGNSNMLARVVGL